MEWKVYALCRNKNCIYVGCTSNLKNRLKQHKSNKNFESYIVLSKHNNRKDALLAERSIIKFLSVFGSDEIYNSKYETLSLEAICVNRIDSNKNNY